MAVTAVGAAGLAALAFGPQGIWDGIGTLLHRDLVPRIHAGAAATWATVISTIETGIAREPAAMLGLAGALAVPLLALTTMSGRWIARHGSKRGASAVTIASERTQPARRSKSAWVEVDGSNGHHVRLGEIARIGIGEDFDIALGASETPPGGADIVIQRTPERAFVIMDLGRATDAALSINGRRLAQSPLRDGDRIEIGTARMTFRQPPLTGAERDTSATGRVASRS